MGLRVESIQTACGDKLSLGNFNVLVGPNNCGKSQTLRDIRDYVATGSTDSLIIVNQIDVKLPAKADGIKAFSVSPHPTPKHVIVRGVSYDLQNQCEFNLDDGWIEQRFSEIDNAENIAGNTSQLLHQLGKYWVAHLDAESRLRMASPTPCYDTRIESPSNAMQAFFIACRSCVREKHARLRHLRDSLRQQEVHR